ncbi:MAG: histidine triad nucleotide-binding protein [Gemmatimonadota bacterium]|nr:MAG: histidine triad nucleotide-binding protein [Gemmatimonadota bacterium]
MLNDCLFCKIAAGDIPATIVAQDDQFVAFRDIDPQAPTHLLVIPREHVASLNAAMDAQMLGSMLLFAKTVAGGEGLSERGYRVVVNTNAEAGQSVFHLHAHVLGGRAMRWPPG